MPDPSRSVGREPDLRTTQQKKLDPDGVAGLSALILWHPIRGANRLATCSVGGRKATYGYGLGSLRDPQKCPNSNGIPIRRS